jgi:putative tryptophan/tyrosine transport system substrate-binding protein
MNRKTGRLRAGLRRRVRVDTMCRSTRRRFLIAAASWPLLGSTLGALAQAKQAPVLIGWLNFGSRDSGARSLAAFKEGLAALGWKEGSQIVIEERWADGRMERLQPLAEELAGKKPAVIVAAPSQTVAAVAKAAPKTPIVHATGSDPVAAGFAVSLARPGGMITGLTNIVTDVQEKFVELLLAAAPKLKRIGFFIDTTTFARPRLVDLARRSAAQYSVDARFAELAKPEDIEPAVAQLAKEGVQGLVVLSSPMFAVERRRIVKLALAQRWPMIAGGRAFAEDGALISYAADVNYRRVAYFVDRILKGAKPGDLPFEQPTKIELIVNRKTAKMLGVVIPDSLILQADRVIE